MPIQSRWSAPIPTDSVQKWVFGSSFGPLPETPQFLDPERPDTHFLTVADYRLWAKRIAVGLQKAGLKPGDRVLLFSGNNLFVPSVFMGVLMAGGIFTGANPTFVARELAHQLKDSDASFLIAAGTSMQIAVDAAAQAGLPKNRIYTFDATALDKTPGKGALGTQHWTTLLAPKDEAVKFDWIEPADTKTTTVCLNYSSGTTGVPKGVEITHYSYVANGVGVIHNTEMKDDYEEFLKRSRYLCFLPLYHAYGQTYFTCNIPKLRLPVYIMPSFDFEKMLKYIQKYKINMLTGVPPILVALAKHPATKKYDLSSLEGIGCGAAPLGPEASNEVEKLFNGRIQVRQGWGMTELTCTGMTWDPNVQIISASVGEMMPNASAKLMAVDGSREITKAKEPGEIWVSAPTLLRGYWRNPKATNDTIVTDSDGTRWLKTGDIGYVESYGPGALFHIVDRIKELIKVKGNQVAPAELESVLLERPDIDDAAVVGVTIKGEELPRAYVVPKAGSKSTPQEIAKWMESRVTRYKWLKGGVVFIDAVPKNPSGKILRKQLRDQAQKEVGDRKPTESRLS